MSPSLARRGQKVSWILLMSSAASCLLAVASMAGPPSSLTSEVPLYLRLGAHRAGAVDPLCVFSARILDASLLPVSNATAELFVDVPSGICGSQPFPGMTYVGWTGSSHLFVSQTDANGRVSFGVKGGGGWDLSACPGPAYNNYQYVAKLFINGVEVRPDDGFGVITVSTPDLNGIAGITPADQSLFLNDRYCESPPGTPVYFARSDFNGDGSVNPADFSILLSLRFGGNSIASCPGF